MSLRFIIFSFFMMDFDAEDLKWNDGEMCRHRFRAFHFILSIVPHVTYRKLAMDIFHHFLCFTIRIPSIFFDPINLLTRYVQWVSSFISLKFAMCQKKIIIT